MEKREGRRVGVKRGQGRKRERLRDGLIFYFHFPNGCSSQGLARPKSGIQKLARIPTKIIGTEILEPLPGTLQNSD